MIPGSENNVSTTIKYHIGKHNSNFTNGFMVIKKKFRTGSKPFKIVFPTSDIQALLKNVASEPATRVNQSGWSTCFEAMGFEELRWWVLNYKKNIWNDH